MRQSRGFTLIELIIYVGIFSIAATLLTGVLTTFTRVQLRESATTAVSQEAQFVIQTIQRLVTDASLIELAKDTASSTLKLRMPVAAQDPTCIQFSNGTVYLMQGNDGINKQTCFATSTPQAKTLTTSKVVVTSLTFKKFENPPSTDTVKIDLTISYNSTNPQESAISRTLQTAIAKVSAATFDSDIIPSADNTYNVGISAQRWKDGLFSGNVGIGTVTPDSILHLRGSSPIFTVQPTGAGEISRIRFSNSAGAVVGDFAVDTGGNMAITHTNLNAALTFTLKDDAGQLERMRITGGGNVGIGTTTPGAKLHVQTSGGAMGLLVNDTSNGYGIYQSAQNTLNFNYGNDADSDFYINYHGYNNGVARYRNLRFANGKEGDIVYFQGSTGNVGIGTTDPGAKLHVKGGASGEAVHIQTAASPVATNYSSRGDLLTFTRNDLPASYLSKITGSWSGAANADNTLNFEVPNVGGTTNTVMTLNGAGELIVGGGNGKINAGTIDPIYNIGGTRYATYVPAIAGKIREEVTGTVSLRNRLAVIDFDDVPRESDLWLFWQITDFGPRWGDLVVIPAAGFDGRVWYKKDPLNNRLIFSGDRSGEVSFRLAAPRFDHEKWPIKSDAQTGGFEISEKPQPRSLLPW